MPVNAKDNSRSKRKSSAALSHSLFESVVLDEEGHMAWLDAQLALIKLIGEPAYVAHHLDSAHPPSAQAAT
jgi:bacterioferritin (cytochrome b1)